MPKFGPVLKRGLVIGRQLGTRLFGRRPAPAWTAGPGSVVYPEAEINNLGGDGARIRIGQNSHIRGRLQTYGHGGRISIGDWSYIGVRTEIWSMAQISIGHRVMIAHGVTIVDGTAHSMDPTERHAHFKAIIQSGHPKRAEDLPGVVAAPVIIEDDVWISFGVTILHGVTIGRGSVIAAHAIVTKNVPPGVVYRCQITPIIEMLALPASPSDPVASPDKTD